MKCPNCGVEAQDEAVECPGCGVIFAKLKEKSERAKREAALALAQAAPARAASDIDLWRGRKIAAGIILLWLVVFGLYYRHAISAAKRRVGNSDILTRPTVMMRDPQTGELRSIPVIVAPVQKR